MKMDFSTALAFIRRDSLHRFPLMKMWGLASLVREPSHISCVCTQSWPDTTRISQRSPGSSGPARPFSGLTCSDMVWVMLPGLCHLHGWSRVRDRSLAGEEACFDETQQNHSTLLPAPLTTASVAM